MILFYIVSLSLSLSVFRDVLRTNLAKTVTHLFYHQLIRYASYLSYQPLDHSVRHREASIPIVSSTLFLIVVRNNRYQHNAH
jgi:hypothetical protein